MIWNETLETSSSSTLLYISSVHFCINKFKCLCVHTRKLWTAWEKKKYTTFC